jgi:predicted RNA-binding protein associated with RNAse of E/G family
MWNPGDVISWRGIYREKIWHVQPTILVEDIHGEIALTLLPGTECIADENYPKGKKSERRRWYFADRDWTLAKYTWQTNRLLLLFEPEKFYSIILFWNHTSHDFLYYYVNFQLPFKRNISAVDTLDLELDLVIHPDFSYEWKDVDDYQQAISHGLIPPEWSKEIEFASEDVMERLEKRVYPFDGSWLDWKPDPSWQPPRLPQDWDVL